MPELATPDGAVVDAAETADRDQINAEFSRAMAPGDPEEPVKAPPDRPEQQGAEPPRRKRGRPPKSEAARTAAAPPAQAVDKDYTDALVALTTMGWSAVAAIPYTTPYAAVIDANQENLVRALNHGAQNNAAIRAKIEALTAGGGGIWVIELAGVTVNMTMQAMQILRDPQVRAEARAATETKFREFLKAQGVQVPEPDGEDAGVPAAA